MKGIMKANELAYDLDFNKIIKAFKKMTQELINY